MVQSTPFVEKPRKGAGSERPGRRVSAPEGAAGPGPALPVAPGEGLPPPASSLINRIRKSTRNTWDLFGDLIALRRRTNVYRGGDVQLWAMLQHVRRVRTKARGSASEGSSGAGHSAPDPEDRGSAQGAGAAGGACAIPFICVPQGVESVHTEMEGGGAGASG